MGAKIKIWVRPGMRGPVSALPVIHHSDSEDESDSHESGSPPLPKSSPEVEAPSTPSPNTRGLLTKPVSHPATSQKDVKTILQTTPDSVEAYGQKRKRESNAPSPSPHKAVKRESSTSATEEDAYAKQPARQPGKIKIQLKGRSCRYDPIEARTINVVRSQSKAPCAVNGDAANQGPITLDTIVVKTNGRERKAAVASRTSGKRPSKPSRRFSDH